MAMILKCKMCGGDIEVNQDMSVGTCLYCGSTMTLPKIDSDKKARLFNRANQYRMECEFDRAYSVYEAILQEDEQEAEAYWGLILSEYGVEYVEDPKSGKRIPTCHRINIKSIKTSPHYENAIKYADSESRFIYEDEAKFLDDLQKKAISVSLKEEPYDVFICYKETGEDGERTQDSLLAESIYEELEKKNIRTFFARISLEDKIGQNFEPFIYSALNSARVMLVVATKNEHCEAVWVKNEWSRYIKFMSDGDKTLIPVYKEMSPYEFPDELSKFQAQDMGKVGAVQDLTRGIQKLLGQTKKQKDNELLSELMEEKFERERKKARREKMIPLLAIFVVVIAVAGTIIYQKVVVPKQIYEKIVSYVEIGRYENAVEYFEVLEVEDKKIKGPLEEACYMIATEADKAKDEENAIRYYRKIPEYKDAKERLLDICYKVYRENVRSNKKEAAEVLTIAIEYANNYDELMEKFNQNDELSLIYDSAISSCKRYIFSEAEIKFAPLAELDYEDSKEYLKYIATHRENTKMEIEKIKGVYKHNEKGTYLILKDNNKVYVTDYEGGINKKSYKNGWEYQYLPEKSIYIISINGTLLEVDLEDNGINIGDSTSYSDLCGSYTKIK